MMPPQYWFGAYVVGMGMAVTLHVEAADNEDWVTIATTAPNVRFAVDVASIKRDGDRVEFNEKLTYIQPDKIDQASGRLIKEKRVLRVMHCGDRTQGMLAGSMHSDTGSLIERVRIDPPDLQMSPIPEASLAARELAFVCSWAAPSESLQ